MIEDDPDVRLGMEIRLQANHYDTFFASDASSAVPEARKHTPDLILLDLGLPGGGGFTAMENVKAAPDLAQRGDDAAEADRTLRIGRDPAPAIDKI